MRVAITQYHKAGYLAIREFLESKMTTSPNKFDMAQMNAAIDKVLALPAASQSKQKERKRSARRKDSQALLVKETRATHQADKR